MKRLHEWVGVGWIDIGPADPKHPTAVEDKK